MPEAFVPNKNSLAAQSESQRLSGARILDVSTPAPPAAFIESAAAVLTNSAKIAALASLAGGIVLLISYLLNEGAPFPTADSSISVLLSLMSVIFVFIVSTLTSAFLLPTFAKLSDNSKPAAATPSFAGKKAQPVGRQGLSGLRRYLLNFGPYLCFLLFVFLGVSLSDYKGWGWIIASGVSLAILAIYGSVLYKARYRNLNNVALSNGYSVISFSFLISVVIAIMGLLNWDLDTWSAAAICAGVPLAVHVLVVTVVTNWRMVVAFYAVMMVVLPTLLGWGYCGGLALRLIGIGGGVPVSIKVRTYGGTGTPAGTEEVTGCLILMTAGDVIIRPTARVLDCKLNPRLLGGPSSPQIGTYSRVERYNRGDVVRVSKFADTCGTVDGLQVGCNPIGLR